MTCKPEFTNFEITKKFKYLVLASDGLWDVVTEEKVVDFISQNNSNSELIATYALDKGSMDNVTVITGDFNILRK